MTLSAAQRVADAFAHRESDRVPLWAIIENRAVYEHVLGPVGDPQEVALDDKIAMHARVYRELGIDMSRAHIWPPPRKATQVTHWAERLLTAEAIADFQPNFPSPQERLDHVDTYCRIIAADSPNTVYAPTIRGIFCPVFETMGLEQFSYACADAPAQVERLMELHTEYARAMAELYAARPEVRYAVIGDDMAFKGALMFPPEWMRRAWRPRMDRVMAPLRRAGVKVIFHSDGDIEALIPDLIEMGFAGINPLEPLAGMDLADLKRRFGRDLVLIGGVDCAELLTFGTPQKIRDEVRRLLDIGAPGGGFVIGDSSQIMPDTPLENVLAFYETVHGA